MVDGELTWMHQNKEVRANTVLSPCISRQFSDFKVGMHVAIEPSAGEMVVNVVNHALTGLSQS
jgi:hypothetical protein